MARSGLSSALHSLQPSPWQERRAAWHGERALQLGKSHPFAVKPLSLADLLLHISRLFPALLHTAGADTFAHLILHIQTPLSALDPLGPGGTRGAH